jgi:hypothetical protein
MKVAVWKTLCDLRARYWRINKLDAAKKKHANVGA